MRRIVAQYNPQWRLERGTRSEATSNVKRQLKRQGGLSAAGVAEYDKSIDLSQQVAGTVESIAVVVVLSNS
ncbi:hypothetical protein ADK88_15910 [Streptomyces sp. NRRL F-2295]|nr:hypothetical protein ADK88_15910 [Streptomyces sp. NRRL F-2295]